MLARLRSYCCCCCANNKKKKRPPVAVEEVEFNPPITDQKASRPEQRTTEPGQKKAAESKPKITTESVQQQKAASAAAGPELKATESGETTSAAEPEQETSGLPQIAELKQQQPRPTMTMRSSQGIEVPPSYSYSDKQSASGSQPPMTAASIPSTTTRVTISDRTKKGAAVALPPELINSEAETQQSLEFGDENLNIDGRRCLIV